MPLALGMSQNSAVQLGGSDQRAVVKAMSEDGFDWPDME